MIKEELSEILDDTIKRLGGNLDPRSCGNKYRQILVDFFLYVNHHKPQHPMGDITLTMAFNEILHER